MAEKLVKIAEFAESFEANLAKIELENNGIQAVVEGEMLPYAGVVSEMSKIELMVFQKDADKAIEILKNDDRYTMDTDE